MPAINRFCQRTTHIARMARLQQATHALPGTSGPCPRRAFITRRAHARYLPLAPPMCPVHRVEMEGLGVW